MRVGVFVFNVYKYGCLSCVLNVVVVFCFGFECW